MVLVGFARLDISYLAKNHISWARGGWGGGFFFWVNKVTWRVMLCKRRCKQSVQFHMEGAAVDEGTRQATAGGWKTRRYGAIHALEGDALPFSSTKWGLKGVAHKL